MTLRPCPMVHPEVQKWRPCLEKGDQYHNMGSTLHSSVMTCCGMYVPLSDDKHSFVRDSSLYIFLPPDISCIEVPSNSLN